MMSSYPSLSSSSGLRGEAVSGVTGLNIVVASFKIPAHMDTITASFLFIQTPPLMTVLWMIQILSKGIGKKQGPIPVALPQEFFY